MGVIQLLFEGFIGGFWYNRLFLKNGEDTHGLFKKIDTGLQVHTEVHHFPFNTFTHVFFLFKDEHVVVEELLQFFIGEVDAKLLEGVEIEDLKASNSNGTSSTSTLGNVLTLGDHLSSDLDTWSGESFAHISRSNTKQVGGLVSNLKSINFSLFISWFLGVLHVTHHDNSAGDLVGVVTFIIRETKNLESLCCTFIFKGVIHLVNNNHTHLTCPEVVLGVVTDHAHLEYFRFFAVHNLVEDV